MSSGPLLANNKTIRILADAEKNKYGVIAAIVYNIEHILGVVQAAESRQSPLIIQVFPWAITFSNGLLIRTAADAASRASVPIAIHLDHCQDEKLVRLAADTLPCLSICVQICSGRRLTESG
jgi:fructose-bisphosphate aldolase class II